MTDFFEQTDFFEHMHHDVGRPLRSSLGIGPRGNGIFLSSAQYEYKGTGVYEIPIADFKTDQRGTKFLPRPGDVILVKTILGHLSKANLLVVTALADEQVVARSRAEWDIATQYETPDDSVTTDKLVDQAVTPGKIADEVAALVEGSAAPAVVLSTHAGTFVLPIATDDGTIDPDAIANDSVEWAKLKQSTVPTMSTTVKGLAKVGPGLAMTNDGKLELDGNGDIATAVASWLNAHPEATTTVQDGAVTDPKLASTGIKSSALVGSGKLFNSSNPFTGLYADLNTVPANEVITYGYSNQYGWPAHSPSELPVGVSAAFMLLTISRSTDRSYASSQFQLLSLVRDDGTERMFYRGAWGGAGSPTWSAWHEMPQEVTDAMLASGGVKDASVRGTGLNFTGSNPFTGLYADLNTVPDNEVVTYGYSNQYGWPAHSPSELPVGVSAAFTMATVSRSTSRAYASSKFQLLSLMRDDGSSALYYRAVWGGAGSPTWGEWERISHQVTIEPEIDLSMFRTVGVVGDSYSSGGVQTPPDYGYHGGYDTAWNVMLARKLGYQTTNFSVGGLTTRTWMEDQDHGLPALQASDPCDAYFIMMGINDSNPDERNVPVGNASDFTTTTGTPDTFYGNMGIIYRTIMEKNPYAVVTFVTCARFGNRYTPYSDAIVNMAETSGSLLIDLRDSPVVNSAWWESSVMGTHPTSKMYMALGNELNRMFSEAAKVGNTNLNTFYVRS